MSIQEQELTRAAAAGGPREGVVTLVSVKGSFGQVQLRGDDGQLSTINLWSDQELADRNDRLERSMWLSVCREALVHGKRLRIILRPDVSVNFAHTVNLLG